MIFIQYLYVYISANIYQGFQENLQPKKKVTVYAHTLDLEVRSVFTKVSLFLENVFEVESTVEG